MFNEDVPIILKALTETNPRPTLIDIEQDWMDKAACKGLLNIFFPEFNERPDAKERRELRAREICQSCAVLKQCLDFAVKHEEQGYWGGTNDEDRHKSYGVKPFGVSNHRNFNSKTNE